MKAREILIASAIRNKGNWEQIFNDIQNKVYPSEEEIEQTKNVQCITMLDDEYPNYLKQMYKPPFVLFYKGDINLLKEYDRSIAVVGSRSPKQTTLNFTEKFVAKQTDKVIITTEAKGVAEKVRKQASRSGIKTIVVLGQGIDYIEVLGNLIISEYPSLTEPQMENFPIRNRIVAGLSNQVCVMDLTKPSGTLMIVNYAVNNNKDVFIVPQIDEEDSVANDLIDQGANCLTLQTTL